jgi:hypothetical protein
MKRFGIIILFVLAAYLLKAQEVQTVEKLTPTLRLFLQDYQSNLSYIIDYDTTDIDVLMGKSFFICPVFCDTLRWPKIMEASDKIYMSKLGPIGLNKDIDLLIDSNKVKYSYNGFLLNNFEIKEVTEKPLFTKYKILINHQFRFENIENNRDINEVNKPFYYELIYYFDPKNLILGDGSSSSGFLYRINSITEKQKYGRFSPQFLGWNNRIGILKVTQNPLYKVTNSLNMASRLETDWLIGGRKYWQFLFTTGLGIGKSQFNMSSGNFKQSFPEIELIDKDQYPFELMAEGSEIDQKIEYNSFELPALFKFEKFFRNQNFTLSLFAGANLQYINNFKSTQSSGIYTFKGKYSFDFFKDPVILSNLPDYNFRSFPFDDPSLSGSTIDVNKFIVSAEAGIEGKYYFTRNLTANVGISFMKSFIPLFENPAKKVSFDVLPNTSNASGNSFMPRANPLFVVNDKTSVDILGFNFGFNYYLSKPMIPFTRGGLKNRSITKIVKEGSVLPGPKESGKPITKEVNFVVNQITGANQNLSYSYIGSSSDYYQRGKIRAGDKKDNKLSFQVPTSNNATLFIEEPYGFEINLGALPSREMGDFNQIKAVQVKDIWAEGSFLVKHDISVAELAPYDIFFFYYDRGTDDKNTGLMAVTDFMSKITSKNKQIFYAVTSSPLCTDSLQNVKSRLFDNYELPYDPNIGFLKSYVASKSLNIRRKLNINIIMPYRGFDRIINLISQIPDLLKIDYNTLEFKITGYDGGGYVPEGEAESVIEELSKNKITVTKL